MSDTDTAVFWASLVTLALLIKPTYDIYRRDRDYTDLLMLAVLITVIVFSVFAYFKMYT